MKEVRGAGSRITGPVAGCLATIAFLYLVAVFNVVRLLSRPQMSNGWSR